MYSCRICVSKTFVADKSSPTQNIVQFLHKAKPVLTRNRCATTIPRNPSLVRASVCDVQINSCLADTLSAALMQQDLSQCLSIAGRQSIKDRLAGLTRCDLSASANGRAAILIPLCMVDGVPSILFTLRSQRMTKHAGEVRYSSHWTLF